ncbi:MAG: DNA-processing protein DprA [Acidobacteriota bacterium]
MNECSAVRLQDTVELTLVPGVGSLTQNRIWSACRDISSIFLLDRGELESWNLPGDSCAAIHSRRYRDMAIEIVDWGVREGVRFVVRGCPEYPPLLEEISDPPMVLYARGNVEVLRRPAVAVVGTRRPTPYGMQMAEGLASDLGAREIAVVSGLARGIDAAAHRGCLKSGGATAAVLGSGIDVIYPREHERMSRSILEKGLLVTEFPPGTSPSPQNFPVRNRIISGLALGTVIVEASEYSGSLITARLAMEQNREVFAVPGNITAPQSFGPNFLIRQGAKLVQTWRDIVEELPSELRHGILREEARPAAPAESSLDLLSDAERSILSALSTDRATLFDRLYRDSGQGMADTCNILLNLEMRGYVRQLPGNLYIRAARPPGKN